jgi:hypothetical protein
MNMYARFDAADAWAIIGPINWYGPSSNLKLMFDRLVCMNGGNPDEKLIDHKDPEKAMALEHTEEWKRLSVNHLEGRTAAFFCYGDEGGDEMDDSGRPKILQHKLYFNPDEEPFQNERDAYAPLVWQCRYGGVEVPDHLWEHCTSGKGKKYSDNQAEDVVKEEQFMQTFDNWIKDFENFVQAKDKVQPGRWRAFGYKPPTNLWKEAKTGIRSWMLRFGITPKDSSVRIQKEEDLNKDTTLHPKKSEGEKLRE